MEAPNWVTSLPAVNASLNGLATVLLIYGYRLIRQGHRDAHKRTMLLALGTSVAFLICYLVYHAALHHYTGEGSKRFLGTGPIRIAYFAILISHVVLAATVPFLAVVTVVRGFAAERREKRGEEAGWDKHRRLAKITFPIWVYVSVTGVIIYVMAYHWPV